MGLMDWLFVWLNGPKPKARRRRAKSKEAAVGAERRRIARFAGLGARVIIDRTEYDVVDWAEFEAFGRRFPELVELMHSVTWHLYVGASL